MMESLVGASGPLPVGAIEFSQRIMRDDEVNESDSWMLSRLVSYPQHLVEQLQ
jgi:hypothetical protein